MSNILEGLNREQEQAVLQNEGTMLVLAGAGCGKTKVLTTRIANLIMNGVSPYQILAVTFTNKAAKEMVERLSKMVGEDNAKKMWVGTFHSISGRILRSDINNYIDEEGKKYDNSFVIYDETDSLSVIKNVIKSLNLDEKIYQPKLIKTIISNAKNKMQNAYSYSTRAKDYRTEKYAQIYTEYQKRLQLNNAIDFDDMLLLAVKLLENNKTVREKYYNKFKHILVDEFQDTNISQYDLIKYIYTNNLEDSDISPDRSLCVVGDVDQSIYSWRGADYKIILNFQSNFKNSTLIKLEQNYRSVSTILEAANTVIENNKQRISRNLYSNSGKGDLIDVYSAQDESDEAYEICRKVKMLSSTHNISNMAVLYRTNSQSRALEEACMVNNIPYKIVGGLKFYDRKVIKDIVAYLKFIYNPDDSQSLKRIINVPKRSIGDTTVNKLLEISENNDIKISVLLDNLDDYDNIHNFSSSTKTKIKSFVNMINDLRDKFYKMNLSEYISYVLDKTGYIDDIRANEDQETADNQIDNLQEFISVAKDFEPDDNTDILGEFLSQVALVSDIDSYDTDSQALTLMTLHSAKGLEYDIIFLSGLEEGIFPHNRALDSNIEMEEERRLMYVGITRAKRKLFLSYAKRRKMWGDYRYNNVSRFISEIPNNLLNYDYSDDKYSTASKNTFVSAVKTIKSNVRTDNDGKIGSVTSFGKNFISPQKRNFIVKNPVNEAKKELRKQNEKEAIQNIIQNNPIKQKILLMKKEQEEKNLKQNKIQEYTIGERVFHSKFGVGNIKEIRNIGSSQMLIIDFGAMGEKFLDAAFSELKKF